MTFSCAITTVSYTHLDVYKRQVQQFSCYKTIDGQGMPSIGGCDIKGEAIPIKFSNNKYVFMLFTGSNIQGTNASFYTNAIHNKIPQNDNESWDVYPENAPMFVTFDNLNDPKTVKACLLYTSRCV